MNAALIAAWIGPLIAAMALLASMLAWLQKKREERITSLINQAISTLDKRLAIVEAQMVTITTHLNSQDASLSRGLESIARIEGRLSQNRFDAQ